MKQKTTRSDLIALKHDINYSLSNHDKATVKKADRDFAKNQLKPEFGNLSNYPI